MKQRDAQVHEDGGDALAAVLGPRVDAVVEKVLVRLVLLPVLRSKCKRLFDMFHRCISGAERSSQAGTWLTSRRSLRLLATHNTASAGRKARASASAPLGQRH